MMHYTIIVSLKMVILNNFVEFIEAFAKNGIKIIDHFAILLSLYTLGNAVTLAKVVFGLSEIDTTRDTKFESPNEKLANVNAFFSSSYISTYTAIHSCS
jgi:hypothetical protein